VRKTDLENLKLRDDDKKFTHCGTITIENDKFTPSITNDLRGAGVYLWVARSDDSYKILYVGKAKDGPKSRLSQHKGGINKKTKTAGARRTQILESIPNEGSLEVFFRASPTMNFRGVNNVSTYSLDEEAFIVRFSPPLNRSKPPVVEVRLIEAMTYTFEHSNESQMNAWIHCLNSLSPRRKKLVEEALKRTQHLVGDRFRSLDMAVVGCYSNLLCGGMNDRPVLVFGKYAKVKFSPNRKFALLALDEGSDTEQQPDILFYEESQQDAVCYSYEQFLNLNDNYEFNPSIANQLAQVLQDIQNRDGA